VFTLGGALVHAGASRAVIGVFEAAMPILARGLFHIARSGVSLDWPVLGLAYLLAAAIEPRLRYER